jgi:alcohol dehydrogenase class IV
MVEKFSIIRTPKIIFGAGRIADLPAILRPYGEQILFITGSGSYLRQPALIDAFNKLEKENFTLYFDKAVREPSPGDIDQMTGRFRHVSIHAVVAIGGGSVLDTGKAVSAMLPLEDTVINYLEGVGKKFHPGIKKFFVAVPTTSGTGSEATANAVLSEIGKNGFKRSLRHENLVPDIALVDPQLTLSCPPEITAASGMDAFTQLMESYLSPKAGDLIRAIALDGIASIQKYLGRVYKDGSDIAARSGMAYAALLSGITLANAGLGLIHGFASSLGGLFNIPHGVICGTMMGVVNRFNIDALLDEGNNVAREKYILLGRILSGEDHKENRYYMQFVANYIDRLVDDFRIKKLGEYGVSLTDLGKIAEITDHKANPVLFEKNRIVEMLRTRM